MNTMSMHVLISGFVQGVGFRYFIRRKAVALGITGWTRNCPDGRVELLAQGGKNELQRLLDDIRRGPERSRVVDVRVMWEVSEKQFKQFEMR